MNQWEGRCLIGRPEMLVQFLLILLTASQVTYACDCQMLTFEKALCPASNKTVVLAHLFPSGEMYDRKRIHTFDAKSAVQARFTMNLITIYKNGSIPLLEISGQIVMTFPVQTNDCGYHFTEEGDYVLAGEVRDKGGILRSNLCQLVIRYQSIANNSKVLDTLQGVTRLNCDNI